DLDGRRHTKARQSGSRPKPRTRRRPEMGALSKRVVVDKILPGSGLQPRPGPHIPTETEVAFESEPRLPSFYVSCVRIRSDECRRELADAVLQVAVERGGRLMCDIHHRSRLLGVRTDQ